MRSSSAASRPRGGGSPLCREHEGEPAPMVEAILKVHFPRGALPARGFRCPVCGDEQLTGAEAKEVQETAHRLGLYGVEDSRPRKLLRTGNSVAVSLDPELVRNVLRGMKPGGTVRVGRQGDRIVIEAP